MAQCFTCFDGLVGHWDFDSTTLYPDSVDDGSIIERGTSPSLVGNDAVIKGSGRTDPLTPGKFGNALKLSYGTLNYAQISPSGIVKSAPLIGFAGSIWFQPESNESNTFETSGVIWERQYNNFDLYTQTHNNAIVCRVRDTDSVMHTVSHEIGSALDTTIWYHAVCSYDASYDAALPSALSLYLVSLLRQCSSIVLLDMYQH